MTRIVGADILEYVRPLDGRSWNPVSRWTERRAPLVVLHAESGMTGIGEAWCRQEASALALASRAARAAEVVGTVLDERSSGNFAGLEARSPAATWADAAARSAVDSALWDLRAKIRGEPLWRTLARGIDDAAAPASETDDGSRAATAVAPARATGDVPVYASGGLYRDGASVDDLAAEIERARHAGFRDVKIKVGGQTLATDRERIAAARQAIGPTGSLWVDAVNQLPQESAVDIALRFRESGATAIQAPVSFDDLATMAEINARALPVIAGEAEFDPARFARMLDSRAAAIVQCNVGLCGGFPGAWHVVRVAEREGAGCTLQAHGTAILLAASLHAGAAMRGMLNVEYHRFHDHLHHLLPEAMRKPRDGRLMLDEPVPGLGIASIAIGEQEDGGCIRLHHRVGCGNERRTTA